MTSKIQTEYLDVNDESGPIRIPYIFKRIRKLKMLRLVMAPEGYAILKVPYGVPQKQALEFLSKHVDWILKQRATRSSQPSLFKFLTNQQYLYANGEKISLAFRFDEAETFYRFGTEEKEIVFYLVKKVDRDRQIKALLRAVAENILKDRVRTISIITRHRLNRISIRDQKSRWGSCSSRGNISLNWRIILLPAKLQDYIIYHEMAHLEHMNHSKDYWQLLTAYDEKARQHDRELSRTGEEIMRLGR